MKNAALALAASVALLVAGQGLAEPERVAPGAISVDGKVTLTPAIAPDGKTAYFSRADCDLIWKCPQLLHVSYFDGEAWSEGERVAGLGAFRVDWPTLAPDGETLVFSWTKPRQAYEDLDIIENFDLFSLNLSDEQGEPQAIMGGDVNRPRAGRLKTRRAFHVQSMGTFTSAGDLYFWDEREDAIGERDVFVARSDGAGGLLPAQPVPAPINSTGRDQLGYVNPAGTVMLLSYPNRGGFGGDDIFISRRSGAAWSEPQNLGDLVNSPAYEGAPRFSPDGSKLLFTSTRAFGDTPEGLLQAWWIDTDELIDAGVLQPSDVAPWPS
ncbi:MAG: hypothetical protein AAGH87_07825 [Pseudomonadota bacterium]